MNFIQTLIICVLLAMMVVALVLIAIMKVIEIALKIAQEEPHEEDS